MTSNRDIEDIVAKLSSDKAKTREEGVKLLNSYFEGGSCKAFCALLDQNTIKCRLQDRPRSGSWPHLLLALSQCILAEVSFSKKRGPKIVLAKTLKSFVQHAEDVKRSGRKLMLLRSMKGFFNHLWDVIRDVPSFQLDYGSILRQILSVPEYALTMKKKVYSGLVLFYINKIKTSLCCGETEILSSKDELFRHAMTLHCLINYIPADIPNELRKDLIQGFIDIFGHLRDEGKIARKLVSSLNLFLLRDGPNIGPCVQDIHAAVKDFMIRTWLTTHDSFLKEGLVLYSRIQLKLRGILSDGDSSFDQLLDLVVKELDQNSLTTTGSFRNYETGRDDRLLGVLSTSQNNLMELAAAVLHETCLRFDSVSSTIKRQKRDSIVSIIKDRLCHAKCAWCCAFFILIHHHSSGLPKLVILDWFYGISTNIGRILGDGINTHIYDGPLWILRGLHELCLKWWLIISRDELAGAAKTSSQGQERWQKIWNALLHWLPLYSNVSVMMDACLKILGEMISQNLQPLYSVPQDFWNLRAFTDMPSRVVLQFVAMFFTSPRCQNLQMILCRRNLLKGILNVLEPLDLLGTDREFCLAFCHSILAVCIGWAPFPTCSICNSKVMANSDLYIDTEVLWKVEEHDKVKENELTLLDHSEYFLASSGFNDCELQETQLPISTTSMLPSSVSVPLWQETQDCLLHKLSSTLREKKDISLTCLFSICSVLSEALCGLMHMNLQRFRTPQHSSQQRMLQTLHDALVCSINVTENYVNILEEGLNCSADSVFAPFHVIEHSTVSCLRNFVTSPLFCIFKHGDNITLTGSLNNTVLPLLERLLLLLFKYFEMGTNLLRNNETYNSAIQGAEFGLDDDFQYASCQDIDSKDRIVDADLDIDNDLKPSILAGQKDGNTSSHGVKCTSGVSFSPLRWRINMVLIISSFTSIFPSVTCDTLANLAITETDPEVQMVVLVQLCRSISDISSQSVSPVVTIISDIIENNNAPQSRCYQTLCAIDIMLKQMICSGKSENIGLEEECQSCTKELLHKELQKLATLLNIVSEMGLVMWKSRKKLVDCICNFVLLDPNTAQPLTEKLLPMLSDPDFRVRLSLSKQICVLFQTWNGHEELFHDVCSNVGVKLVKVSRENIITAREVLETGIQAEPFIETALVTLGQLAETSEKIEEVAVFMICATAAINPMHRLLVRAILDRLAKCLNYATRFKYLEQLMGSILGHWVKAQLSLAALVEMREIFVPRTEPKSFVQNCSALLLPLLILSGNDSELKWLAMVVSEAVSTFVKNHFASIFAACLPLHCRNNRCDQERAEAVLQGSLLHIINISEDERDILIKKQMVSIVSSLISLCSSISEPYPPYFPKDVIISAIKTLVDGFLEIDQNADDGGVVDKINVFRPDRVFLFLLQIHYQIDSAVHHRHRSNPLARLAVLIAVIKHRVCVPSTCRYAFHIVLQSLKFSELQDHCCSLMSSLLDIFEHTQSEDTLKVLGSQLQSIVSKLVGCCLRSDLKCGSSAGSNLQVLSLLHRLTVDANPSLYDYIKELDPFPDSDCFIKIQEFHQQLCADQTPADELIKFGKRSVSLPSSLRLKSLQSLHRKLKSGKMFSPVSYMDSQSSKFQKWPCDDRLVCAVWSLVDVCHDDSAADMRDLVGDFIARVGFGDPYAVVFHLPESVSQEVFTSERKLETVNVTIGNIQGVSGDAVKAVIKLLEQYLLDDSVRVVDIAAKSLRGLLSTEKGQKVLHSMSSSEAAYIRVLAKGVNNKLVENLLSECHLKDAYDVTLLEDRSLWQIGVKTYDEWISQLVYSLIHYTDDPILRLCQEMVLLKAQLAELVFPHVLGILAGRKDENFNLVRIISNQIEQNIFAESNRNLRSIQLVLHAMNELRLCHVLARLDPIADNLKRKDNSKHIRHSATRSRNSDRILSEQSVAAKVHRTLDSVWKKIDYLVAAKAAIRCGSYFTSILYVEHWCEENYGVLTLGDPDFSYHEQLPEHIEVLLKATKNINEPDGIYGIRSSKLVSQIFTSEHEGNWIKALQNYDLVLRTSPAQHFDGHHDSSGGLVLESGGDQATSRHEVSNWSYYKGLMKSLQQTGCSHLLDLYSEGLASRKTFLQQDFEFSELQYEAAWRAGKWDFYWVSPEMKSLEWGEERDSQQVPFNFYLHSCLRSLEDGDAQMFWMNLKNAKQELVSVLSHTSRESTQNIHSTITKLQILYHISQAWEMRWKPPGKNWANQNLQDESSSTGPFVPSNEHICWLDADWKYITNQMQLHFNLLEPFISFRRVLFQILNCNYSSLQHLIEYAKIFRKCGRLSQAATAVHEFKLLYTDMENKIGASPLCFSGRLEEAKLLRARGQSEMAINLVEYLLKHYELGDELADICRLTGKWLAEGRSRSSRTILDQYLKRAAEITEEKCSSNKSIWIERQCKTHFCLAHYTDALFQSYQERLASNEWQAALKLRRYKAKELEAVIKRLKSLTKGEKTDYAAKVVELQKQLTMDTEEAKRLQDDMDSFLIMALKSYQCCLLTGEKYNIRVVFRLVSLWLNLASNQTVVESMLETVKKVQSYKFLPLVYQIASRMGGSKDSQGQSNFQLALTFLVKKMAIDHPHHTIFQLLALANGDRVKDKQRSRSAFVVDVDKIRASEELLCELQSHHYALLCEMKQMVEIYIKLAELETKKEDTNRKILLPRDVRSVRKLELVPVITANLPVDRSCQYPEGSFPYFNGLSDHIRVMNGINAPKVVECYGSDGRKYRQLAKSGNDDLRQDAVMEQFFGLVNTLLQEHTDTLKRQLKIRTYKVVPFTPSAGVLEWVDGTIPLGEYLIGSTRNGGAHGRYRKDDWPFLTCREHMANQKDKRKAFQTVCQNFRPAMHFFFLERFSRPADWFEKRLAYTRSVATSSMVGYIVGLGDRHSMNILIDQATAEVVHIDLGVAFEQGLMLKTPERVPFRLTRDMIDGMGATGIEGVFRRCCEETLSVMRTNKEALLTIIEVFIHDPLYKWALSPLKALRRQQDFVEDEDPDEEDPEEDNEGNKDAARALLRVKQKLDGYEDGEMRSIPGQVQQLIQDAMDVERLCQMFPGWGAWL